MENNTKFNSIINMPRTRQFQDVVPRMYPELLNSATEFATMNITFVVTESCNLACTYCYECNKNHNAFMTKDVAKKAIDTILDQEKCGHYLGKDKKPFVIIEFIGGEPFLNVDVMDFIVEYMRYKAFEMDHPWYKNYMINITTNGVLWFDTKVQKFINKHKNKLSFTITIDGHKELHDACRIFPDGTGSHHIVEKAVKDAVDRFNMRDSKVTFAPENIKYINKAIPYLWNLGLRNIHANPVYENVWKDEHAIIYYNELIKLADWFIDNDLYYDGFISLFDTSIGQPMSLDDDKNWCGGDGQMLAVGTDGRFFPCIRFMRYSLQNKDREEIEIGDMNRGIDTPDNNEKLKELISITRTSQSTQECINCKVAQGCAWCTGYNYDCFGTPNKRATYICKLHKARSLANEYFWNKLYKKLGIDNMRQKIELDDDMKYILGGEKHE